MILRDAMGYSLFVKEAFLNILVWMFPFYLLPLSVFLNLPIYFLIGAFLIFVLIFYRYGFTGFFILQGFSLGDAIKKAQVFNALSFSYKLLLSMMFYYLVYRVMPAYFSDILISLFATQWFFSSMKDLNLMSVGKFDQ